MNQDRHSSLASRHPDGWQNADVPQAARSGKPNSSDGPSSPRLPQDFAQERNGFVQERNVGRIPGKLMLDGPCSALALLPGRTYVRPWREHRAKLLGRMEWPGRLRRLSKCRWAWKSTRTPARRANRPNRNDLPGSLGNRCLGPWQTPSQ